MLQADRSLGAPSALYPIASLTERTSLVGMQVKTADNIQEDENRIAILVTCITDRIAFVGDVLRLRATTTDWAT